MRAEGYMLQFIYTDPGDMMCSLFVYLAVFCLVPGVEISKFIFTSYIILLQSPSVSSDIICWLCKKQIRVASALLRPILSNQ